ncbi:16S rRNA (cytosine(1402)-N(4))-methyltransferase RsmH [Novosphingopyxis sp. YJ-S2-01]|uniref:16S rRNA (cytosine(1402)-N(4))-methyltransferase RsmH n=1 Tax=Novosphingopyxis sp. YJ-S2-01 TaxID=2794021 RepID=UPI0018DC1B53|nr:16S rRNA (cytosine(1402)-N(4))-methyltransferase RsmH [Novosphingopyxis sp. YJ-S2-01]MBH9537610.1 16S rRNA (cytosine(1402)-N(4))-methyltransferase RsmH [Novosphingopyxis sp. YJ-S2-01]
MSAPEAPHIPVLLEEVVHAAAITPGARIVDGTFGAGGYSSAFLAQGANVYAFDRDPSAIAQGAGLAGGSKGRLRLFPARFSDMASVLKAEGIEAVDAVVLDIGVSSMQLDEAARGFSFRADGPLDMRMGQDGPSAADFLNEADEEEIADVIYLYGEERRSRRIAKAIVAARPLTRTGELAAIVRKALGHREGMPKDPATRTFQAIRIHVNAELDELREGLAAAEKLLRPGGRLVVVSFHSLEDRIVKQFLRVRSGQAGGGSRHLPLQDSGPAPSFARPSKAIRAGEDELDRNPRARSAVLRWAERTDASPWQEQAA